MMTQSIARYSALTLGVLLLPTLSWAAECQRPCCATGASGKGVVDKTVVEQAKESCITGDLGVNIVSQYINRGSIYENQGAIIQPYADLYFKLYEGEGFLNKVSLNLGIWNSFHSRKTDAGAVTGTPGTSSTRSFYEFDFTPGLTFTFAKNFQFTPTYLFYLSPNDGFSTYQGLNLKFAYDDTDLLGAFALHPSVQVMFELENKLDGSNRDQGIYYEVGIAPTVPAGPVTLSFPIAAGFGSNDFYAGDQGFGFVSAGVQASYPLAFMPECYGTWTAVAGVNYYHLGDGLDGYNTPEARGDAGIRDSNENEWIWNGGLSVAF